MSTAITTDLAFHSTSVLEIKDGNAQVVVGKQSYSPGNGLIASMEGICGVRTTFKNDWSSATLYYGNNGQDIVAGDFSVILRREDKLTLGAAYFKIDYQYVGISAASKISKNAEFRIDTAENMNTGARGFMVTTKYGKAEHRGQSAVAVSYRYVELGAISSYSDDSDFDDSIGLRVETTYKLKEDLTITAFQDFAKAQDNSNKSQNRLTLSWDFSEWAENSSEY